MKELKRSYGFTRDRAERISLNTQNAYLKKYSSKEKPYLKLYIAVLDEVADGMVPTLVAHSILRAHELFSYVSLDITEEEFLNPTDLYYKWFGESFRKCVVRVNRKEFEKIKQLDNVYLGHENTTLNGEKSCAVVYPLWSDNLPNVLKFAKLWSPKNENSISNSTR